MNTPFKFLPSGQLVDRELELVLARTVPADPVKCHCPSYEFAMVHAHRRTVMGKIRLRIASTRALRYPGHIGYDVAPKYRGHCYAARSSQLLLPLACAHGLKTVWLSVNPDNTPSLKTCQLIGARYIETVRIPHDHEMYAICHHYCRRYLLACEGCPETYKTTSPPSPGGATDNSPAFQHRVVFGTWTSPEGTAEINHNEMKYAIGYN